MPVEGLAVLVEAVYLEIGDVMAILTVQMEVMKTTAVSGADVGKLKNSQQASYRFLLSASTAS